MRKARIFQPAKSAMQSGRAKTDIWRLEYEPEKAHFTERLMGWTGNGDTATQIRLKFPTLAEAEAYAQKHNIPYTVRQPHSRTAKSKSYAANFAFDKRSAF